MKKEKNKFLLIIFFSVIINFPLKTLAYTMRDYQGIVFPPDHALNMPIDSLPVHPNSDNYIKSIGANTSLHPDFGTEWENQPKCK